jgi:hypothetical protein
MKWPLLALAGAAGLYLVTRPADVAQFIIAGKTYTLMYRIPADVTDVAARLKQSMPAGSQISVTGDVLTMRFKSPTNSVAGDIHAPDGTVWKLLSVRQEP